MSQLTSREVGDAAATLMDWGATEGAAQEKGSRYKERFASFWCACVCVCAHTSAWLGVGVGNRIDVPTFPIRPGPRRYLVTRL